LGLLKRESVQFRGQSIIPREIVDHILSLQEQEEEEEGSEFCATVLWVLGEKNRELIKLNYEFIIEHEKRWGNTKTGVPLSIGILMIGRGDIKKRGFTVPEECIEPNKFIEEMKKRGFIFKETEERIRTL